MTPPLVVVDFVDTGLASHESWSPFVLKVERTLKLLRLPYTRRLVGGPWELKRLNPAGQVPVLLVGDEVVTDSTRIVQRLADIAGASLGGAEDRLWEELADTALYGFSVAVRWADDDNFPRTRDRYFLAVPNPVRWFLARSVRAKTTASTFHRDVTRNGLERCWERYRALLADLDARAPVDGFWTGPEPTIADVALFAQLHSLRTPISPVQAAFLDATPRLVAWMDRVDGRTRGGPLLTG